MNSSLKFLSGLLIFIAIFLGYACHTTSWAAKVTSYGEVNPPRNLVTDVNNPITTTFLDMLRAEPGLEIRGTGSPQNVLILVRGVHSITGDNNPLYVLDGVPVGRSFYEVNALVDVHSVASIRVLKGLQAGI